MLVDDVLAELEKAARENFFPSIGPITGKIIGNIIKSYKPKRGLGIGTLHGYSAIFMAKTMVDYDNNDNTRKNVVVVTLDIDPNLANIAIKNIEKTGLSNKIKVINGDALKVTPELQDYKFDLIFLDAVKSDYLKYLILVEESNLIKEW